MARKVTTMLPNFGSNRMHAEKPAEFLDGLEWIGVPFCAGMPEVCHMSAGSIVVNDKHCHVINLARCIRRLPDDFLDDLRSRVFHPMELKDAQERAANAMGTLPEIIGKGSMAPGHAADYFVSQWMGRSGKACTRDEFKGGISARWKGGGGGSGKRYRSAVESVDDFHELLQVVECQCLDFREFLKKVQDHPKSGLYCDPPWPDDGDRYWHPFNSDLQRELCRLLLSFHRTRIVVRFGDHPLIRELYSETDGWEFHEVDGRTQANSDKRELLIVRNIP